MSNTMPNIREMDARYEKYYLVHFPDCQKFEELDDGDYIYTVPAYIDGEPVCFVDVEWVNSNYGDED